GVPGIPNARTSRMRVPICSTVMDNAPSAGTSRRAVCPIDEPVEAEAAGEEDTRQDRRGNRRLVMAGEERFERRSQQPHLDDQQDGHERDRAVDGGESPVRGAQGGAHACLVPRSIPTAQSSPWRSSMRMRGRGRGGGPFRTRPSSTEKSPSWHGHPRRLLSDEGKTAHDRCVHFWLYATQEASP